MKLLFAITVIFCCAWGWVHSYQQSKKGRFFTNTQFLWPLGVYVWGDGLVLFLAWIALACLWYFSPSVITLKLVAVFYLVRSAYEVVYWLQHQALKSSYKPPLPGWFDWLTPEQAAICYQLIHTVVVTSMLTLLIVL